MQKDACCSQFFLSSKSFLTLWKKTERTERVGAGSGQLLGTGVSTAWDFIKVKSRAKAGKMVLCSMCLRNFALLGN